MLTNTQSTPLIKRLNESGYLAWLMIGYAFILSCITVVYISWKITDQIPPDFNFAFYGAYPVVYIFPLTIVMRLIRKAYASEINSLGLSESDYFKIHHPVIHYLSGIMLLPFVIFAVGQLIIVSMR